MPFLVKCNELFRDSSVPVASSEFSERSMVQAEFHRHEYFEMLFVAGGSLINRRERDETLLKTGDLLIMKPYVSHLLKVPDQKKRPTVFYCSFLPQMVDSGIHSLEELKGSSSSNRYFFEPFWGLLDDDVSAIVFSVPPLKRAALKRIFGQLREHSALSGMAGLAHTRNDFLGLLLFLSDEFTSGETQVLQQAPGRSVALQASRYHKGIEKAFNHIHDHFSEPLSLEEMAAMSGISVSYFCTLFKHITGTTFLTYVNGLRIEQACIFLRDTSESAADIGYKVGFNDYSHFHRQFKKATGKSPGEYRAANRNGNDRI